MIRHMSAITLLTFILIGATLKSSEGAKPTGVRTLTAPSDTFQGRPAEWWGATLKSSEGVHPRGLNGRAGVGRVGSVAPSDTFQGRPAEWWARKTTHWKRAALARGRTLAVVKRAARHRYGATLMHGIELAATAYGQSASALRRVSYCESRHYLYARSSGGHLGPFQFAPSTWASTPYGRFSVFDPIAAPLAAAWMWRQGRRGEWACR